MSELESAVNQMDRENQQLKETVSDLEYALTKRDIINASEIRH